MHSIYAQGQDADLFTEKDFLECKSDLVNLQVCNFI